MERHQNVSLRHFDLLTVVRTRPIKQVNARLKKYMINIKVLESFWTRLNIVIIVLW